MERAIGIKATAAERGYDPAASKFFGDPTLPPGWEAEFYEEELFFCQIRLSDIKDLDPEGRLPHSGYLYVFLHTEDGMRDLRADVRYYDGEPGLVLDGFNSEVEGYQQFDRPYLMEFFETDESYWGTRLLGLPSDWPYADPAPSLLMQYDPLDNDMGFLDSLDGFLYFLFGGGEYGLEDVTLWEEYT